MMKEFKLEDILPVQDVKEKIWSIFGTLGKYGFAHDEYDVVLYLLSIYKEGFFNEKNVKNLGSSDFIDINKVDKKLAVNYVNLQQYYAPLLSKFTGELLTNVRKQIKGLNKRVLKEHFAEIFDEVLSRVQKAQGRSAGQFMLPSEVSRFLSNLVDLPAKAKIFNPFAGAASLGVHFDQGQDYFGQELNPTGWATGALRLLAYDRPGNTRFAKADPVKEWPVTETFDLVIGNPPFNVPLSQDLFDTRGGSVAQYFMREGIKCLNADGKLIALLNQGFLSSSKPDDKAFRALLITEDLVDTIISLPAGLLTTTAISLTVVVLNKNKKYPGKIRLIKGERFFRSLGTKEKVLDDYALNNIIHNQGDKPETVRLVDSSEMIAPEYNLTPALYFLNEITGIKLGDIVQIIRGKRCELPTTGKVVRIRDLKNDLQNFYLDVNSIEESEVKRAQLRLIDESSLLVAGRWKTLKPTFFKYEGTPIIITEDILAFKVDETKCLVDYLILQLHEVYVQQQVEARMTGSIAPLIRREDLLSITIKVPSLKEQRNELADMSIQIAQEKEEREALGSRIKGLEAEIHEQNTFLRHSLAGPASNLKDTFANLRNILVDKVLPVHPDLLTLKVSDKHLANLGRYLEVMERDIKRIAATISSQLKVDAGIEEKPLVPVEIFSFIKQYSQESNDRRLNFHIEFGYDNEAFHDENDILLKTYIKANAELLSDLFDNLIENARKHAFDTGHNNRIEIHVMKADGINPGITILFSNTGKPFPADFTISDFKRKGTYRGDNGGDGFGGWYIARIIERLGGTFDIIDETGPEGVPDSDLATSFEINFPLIEITKDEEV